MWAHACLQWGSEDVKLLWPYIEAKMTSEEIRAEMDRIEKAIANVHGRESLDSD